MTDNVIKITNDGREFVKELSALIWESEYVIGFKLLRQGPSTPWPNSILVVIYLVNAKVINYVVPSIEIEMASMNKVVFASYIWDNILEKIKKEKLNEQR